MLRKKLSIICFLFLKGLKFSTSFVIDSVFSKIFLNVSIKFDWINYLYYQCTFYL